MRVARPASRLLNPLHRDDPPRRRLESCSLQTLNPRASSFQFPGDQGTPCQVHSVYNAHRDGRQEKSRCLFPVLSPWESHGCVLLQKTLAAVSSALFPHGHACRVPNTLLPFGPHSSLLLLPMRAVNIRNKQ